MWKCPCAANPCLKKQSCFCTWHIGAAHTKWKITNKIHYTQGDGKKHYRKVLRAGERATDLSDIALQGIVRITCSIRHPLSYKSISPLPAH